MKALAMCAVMAGVLGAAPAMAGPVVREGSGANAAAIQAVVDQFRADLGGANNGNTPGTQPLGRREINWDGGGATAPLTLDPIPMTRFSARGARFITTGSGFAISGLPLPEFGELNGAYPDAVRRLQQPAAVHGAEQQRAGRGVPRAGRSRDAGRCHRVRGGLHRRGQRHLDEAAVLHSRRRAALRTLRPGGRRQRDAVVPGRALRRRRDRRPGAHRQRQRGPRRHRGRRGRRGGDGRLHLRRAGRHGRPDHRPGVDDDVPAPRGSTWCWPSAATRRPW